MPARPPQHPRNCDHHIQFYHAEDSLFDAISSFVLPSFFSTTHAAVIVATKAHIENLDSYLRAQNLVPELLRKRDQLFIAQADPILERITPGGKVSEAEFNAFFGPLFAKIQKKYPKLLVYGELVNILCEGGEHEKAHELEMVWEGFLVGKEASLLCGYNMAAFAGDGLEDVFQRLCKAHSVVVPAESGGGGGPSGGCGGSFIAKLEDHQMVLAMLQQKNLRLAAEMGRRVAAEMALQSTLDHLGDRPSEGIQIRDRDGEMARIDLSPVGIVAATSMPVATMQPVVDYFFNQRFLELAGLTEILLRAEGGWVAAVHYQDRERVSHYLRLSDGKERRCEYRFVLANGELRWMSGETISRSSGYVHTCVDISPFRDAPQPPPPQRSESTDRPLDPHGTKRTQERRGSTTPHDQTIRSHLYNITQLFYNTLHPPLPAHPPIITPPSTAPQLTALTTWLHSLPDPLHPNSSAFTSNADPQRELVRLAHIAHLTATTLLTLPALLRATSSNCSPSDIPASGTCVDAASRCLNLLSTLLSPPHAPTVLALHSFHTCALTIMLHIAAQPTPPTPDPLVALVQNTLAALRALLKTCPELLNCLDPFLAALAARAERGQYQRFEYPARRETEGFGAEERLRWEIARECEGLGERWRGVGGVEAILGEVEVEGERRRVREVGEEWARREEGEASGGGGKKSRSC